MNDKRFDKFKAWILPKIGSVDTKISTLIPDIKLRKILYILLGSVFVFIFLIIILGTIFVNLENIPKPDTLILNKPEINTATNETLDESTKIQEEMLQLETSIKKMVFPDSLLNIPQIKTGLSI